MIHLVEQGYLKARYLNGLLLTSNKADGIIFIALFIKVNIKIKTSNPFKRKADEIKSEKKKESVPSVT